MRKWVVRVKKDLIFMGRDHKSKFQKMSNKYCCISPQGEIFKQSSSWKLTSFTNICLTIYLTLPFLEVSVHWNWRPDCLQHFPWAADTCCTTLHQGGLQDQHSSAQADLFQDSRSSGATGLQEWGQALGGLQGIPVPPNLSLHNPLQFCINSTVLTLT
jgi:hypothetical protein